MTLSEQKDIYPRLLLRHYGVLAFLAGLVAVRYCYPGLLALGLLLVLGVVQKKKFVHAFFFCLCFGAALVYGQARSPLPPAEPLWLVQAMGHDDPRQRPLALYVTGEVAESDVYADGRIRLILKNVAPAPWPEALSEYYAALPEGLAASLENAEAYTGNMAVTLWQAEKVPLAGQIVTFNGRFAKVRGFANTDVFTIDTYWHDREVWVRGWNIRGKHATDITISGEPYFFAGLRNALWRDFVLALPAMGGGEEGKSDAFRPDSLSALQGTGQAFLPALIFGDRSGLTPHQKDLLSKATLTHSIALSGLHLAYVGIMGIGLAFAMVRMWPGMVLRVPRPKLCFLMTVPLALLYLWIGGAPLSLIRSALMLFFFGLILFGNKTKVLMDGLFAAVLLIALVWPWSLFDLSLQLSALSVGVIALFYPLVTGLARLLIPVSPAQTLGWYAKDRLRAALSLLFMSLCIQIALSPLLVKTFGAVGLWFPLNLIWLPVLGAIVMPLAFVGFFCVCCGWTALAAKVLHAASLPCQWLMDFLQWMDGAGYLAAPLVLRPHWLATAGLWLFLGLLPPLVWHARRIFRQKSSDRTAFGFVLVGSLCGTVLASGMTLLAYYRYERQDVSLTMLDVGHGQAVVITWPGGRALVDGGGFPNKTFDVGRMVVAPYLTAGKPAKVDWLINSHPDYDHLGGMLHIFEGFTITQGFAGNGEAIRNTLRGDFQRIVANKSHVGRFAWGAGDYIALWDEPGNELGLEVLWPPKESLRVKSAGQQGGIEQQKTLAPEGRETQTGEGGAAIVTTMATTAKTAGTADVSIISAMATEAGTPRMITATETAGTTGVSIIPATATEAGTPRMITATETSGTIVTSRTSGAGATAETAGTKERAETAWQTMDNTAGGSMSFTGNDASLVLRLVWRGKGLALLCGDTGKKSLRHLLENTPAEALRAEILVLPHHGSKSSYSKGLYEAVDPGRVLVSCAYKNSWGFPNKAIEDTLGAMGKPLYSTAVHGMVKVVWPNEDKQGVIEIARGDGAEK